MYLHTCTHIHTQTCTHAHTPTQTYNTQRSTQHHQLFPHTDRMRAGKRSASASACGARTLAPSCAHKRTASLNSICASLRRTPCAPRRPSCGFRITTMRLLAAYMQVSAVWFSIKSHITDVPVHAFLPSFIRPSIRKQHNKEDTFISTQTHTHTYTQFATARKCAGAGHRCSIWSV